MGEVSRIAGVFFEPKKTFQDIARRPSWVVPVVLLILVSVGYAVALGQRVTWDRVIAQQQSSSARFQQQQTPEERERVLAIQRKFVPVSFFAGSILGPPIATVIVAAILLGMTALMSAGLRFKQVFAVAAWSALPRVISVLLTIVVVFLKNPDDFNIRNPLAFNVGAFLDPNSGSKFVYTLATALDLFVFWGILLTAMGLKAGAGKKLSFAGALVAVIVPWAFFTLCGAAITGAFS